MRTCVASLSWYDFKVCLHCSVYLYFILLCVRLLHCVDVPLVVCPSSWWLTFGLFPALGCREYCRCVFVGVRIFNSFGHIPKSGFVGSCLFYVFNLFLAQDFSKTHYRPPRVWERLYGTYDTSLDVPGSRSEYERLQIAVMRPRCSRGVWTFRSVLLLLFLSAALPSLAHDREEKALEFGRLGSCLTSTTYWLCSHAQNCLSMPQFPRLKNGRNNTVALLVIASAVIVSCHSPGGVSDRSLFFHSSGG